MSARGRVVVCSVLVAAIAAAAGCSTGSGAVTQGGSFDFVSPGGRTDILYDQPDLRGRPGAIAGPDLAAPARTLTVDTDFAGQVVIINVWGQWCAPCRTEAPELEKIYQDNRARGVTVVGIDVRDNDIQTAVDFVTDRRITYPSVFDPAMRTLIAFGGRYPTSVVPSTIVLDRRHRVAAVFLRALLADDLQLLVERLADEPPAGS